MLRGGFRSVTCRSRPESQIPRVPNSVSPGVPRVKEAQHAKSASIETDRLSERLAHAGQPRISHGLVYALLADDLH